MRSLKESIIRNSKIGKYAKELGGLHIDDICYSTGKHLRFYIVKDIDLSNKTVTVQRIDRSWEHNDYYSPNIKKEIGPLETYEISKTKAVFWINKYALLKKWDGKPKWSIV